METYDLVVLGAGPGGTPAAMAAAQFGKKVLLVDKRDAPGGECLFEGCIPSKVLENAANRYAMLEQMKAFHIDVETKGQIHWEAVLADKSQIVKQRSLGALKQMERFPNLTFKQGKATFVDAHTLDIDGEKVSFDYAVVATGADAYLPPFEGEGVAHAWTNADVFKHSELPEEITFIGAGAISCELAQMFNKLGTTCRMLERGERILKHIDEECALVVQQKMIDAGIDIRLNVTFGTIDGKEGDFTVHYTQNGEAKSLSTPHLLIATGRAANVEGIGLENAGIAFDRHGIKVDETLQTTQPNIYAVGDCTVGPKFAHWATYQAGIAIHNIFAPMKHKSDMGKLSWVLFSDPQIASVGLSEADAAKAGIEVETARYDFATDARAQIDKAAEGFLKYVIEKKSGIIRGIQIVSEDASSLSGEASLIVANEMTAMDVMKTIHPHPTLTESFGTLAKQVFFKSMMQRR